MTSVFLIIPVLLVQKLDRPKTAIFVWTLIFVWILFSDIREQTESGEAPVTLQFIWSTNSNGACRKDGCSQNVMGFEKDMDYHRYSISFTAYTSTGHTGIFLNPF